MQTIEGTITIVQESRFQLTDKDGVSHQFLLSHSAPLEPDQLLPLQHNQAHVRVNYTKAHNIIGFLAYSITRLDR